jgi:hypothetical protein
MADIIDFQDFKRSAAVSGPEAVQALLCRELAAGVSVHAAAWAFAMPDEEWQESDMDIDEMARLLANAGLAYWAGNDDNPAVLVLAHEAKFRRTFASLGCKEAALAALGSGILIRRRPELCR